jgi:hypothetical protein
MLDRCGWDLANAAPRPPADAPPPAEERRSPLPPAPPGLDERDEMGLDSALDVLGEDPELPPEKERRVDGGRSLLGFATAPADLLRATTSLPATTVITKFTKALTRNCILR